MNIINLHRELDDLARDNALFAAQNVRARADALDFIRFVEEVVAVTCHDEAHTPAATRAQIRTLAYDAAQLKQKLAAANATVFQQLRMAIRGGLRRAALRHELNRYTQYTPHGERIYMDFDGLDVLLDGVFETTTVPPHLIEPAPEMVHYEDTPARAILDMTDHVAFGPNDLFYDLGSGLGQVAILVHLLTGVCARGVEVEPAYVAVAQRITQELAVSGVDFLNVDAREADYTNGTIFFMFTPFKGALLRNVLARLRQEAADRALTVCTFGPCTPRVAEEPWLHLADPAMNHEYRLAVFQSTRAS